MSKKYQTITSLIGNTPIVKVNSLSRLTGVNIYAKCEFFNPGGSIKDRAALKMVEKAIEREDLKAGMTIVEGTAGNTGIGLALVAKSLGLNMTAVMPKGQTLEKQKMIELYGAQLHLVDPCPFKDEKHFYHTAKNMSLENPQKFWWANQFENTDNALAHIEHTAPEIEQVFGRDLDMLVCAAGSGGTLGGVSNYLKSKNYSTKFFLVDPMGSGLANFTKTGEFKSSGSSITEGIGIMRLVENFKMAEIDGAFNLDDQDIVTLSQYVRNEDGLILGSSSALNLAGAFYLAIQNYGTKKNILTFLCDLGERSSSKLYNHDFLKTKALDITKISIEPIIEKYKSLNLF
jgi:cysteine synthase A